MNEQAIFKRINAQVTGTITAEILLRSSSLLRALMGPKRVYKILSSANRIRVR